MNDWQPIDTAPKDGAWILLTGGKVDEQYWRWDSSPDVVSGHYTDKLNTFTVEGHWQFAWYDGGYYGEYENPTHWMPLPEPPKP